jgi:hypothetical protein
MHRLFAVGLAAILACTGVATAGPKVTYDPDAGGVALVHRGDVDGPVNNLFLLTAHGQEEVADSNVVAAATGVLFQAAAKPGAGFEKRPLRLSHAFRGENDVRLLVKLGEAELASDAPAWVWAVAARFALHPATGAVTLVNNPQTPAEKLFTQDWLRKHGAKSRLTWARYHPMLADTLIGFHLIVADAMMGDPVHYHTVVNGLDYTEPYGRASLGDSAKRLRHARTLEGLLRLDSKPADCSMLNDVESQFLFSAQDGKLQLTGTADYQFSRMGKPGEYHPNQNMTRMIRSNRRMVRESSPVLYDAVDDFSRHVAFFNHVHKVDPDALTAFVSSLDTVLARIPAIETPIALPIALP